MQKINDIFLENFRKEVEERENPDVSRAIEAAKTLRVKNARIDKWRGAYTNIPNKILLNTKATYSARFLYIYLLMRAFRYDYCFPGQETIAQDMGVSSRSVIRWLKELEELEWVTIKKRGQGRPNIYYLCYFED